MSDKDTGGPAFPIIGETLLIKAKGMTLRDYFAAKAMQGMFSHKDWDTATFEQHATSAYEMADAMLEERKK